ncbi:MAG: helix-turn-helix transcriptional regulator [Bacteroidales bacterium]|nr:helix-turn-helix transcriptional regulator [Bacteroidales bacterium]
MISNENLEVILFSLPIYQLLYFTIQLISFKKTNSARRYLGLLLLSMTGFLLLNALYYSANETLMVWMYFIFIPLLLTLPPLYFLYILSLVKEKNHLSTISRFILFIPPLLVLLLNLVTYGFNSNHQKLIFLNTDVSLLNNPITTANYGLLVFWTGAGLLLIVQLVLAAFKTVKLLKMEHAAVQMRPSHLPYMQFNWVYLISSGLFVFMVAAAAQLLVVSNQTIVSAVAFNLVILFSSGVAGYFAMKQDDLFTQVSRVGLIKPPKKTPDRNHPVLTQMEEKKVVPDDGAGEIIRKIETHFLQDKPYLDQRFAISDLSRKTGIGKNKLTLVINEVMGKNFYSLINDYRVREAMDMMKANGKNYTIDAVADMSGFQSRSSFYACFKKYTGQTPREFMANLKQDNQPTETKKA